MRCKRIKKVIAVLFRTQGPEFFVLSDQHIITWRDFLSLPFLLRIWSNKRVRFVSLIWPPALIYSVPAQSATCNNTRTCRGSKPVFRLVFVCFFVCPFSFGGQDNTVLLNCLTSSALLFARSLLFLSFTVLKSRNSKWILPRKTLLHLLIISPPLRTTENKVLRLS